MNQEKISEFKFLLVTERETLERELSAIAKPDPKMKGDWDAKYPGEPSGSGPAASSSQEEQADIREEWETEIAQEHVLEERLQAVNAALERIEKGTYGICASCGQPIPEERLRANPAATFDIEHQPAGGRNE